MSTPNPVNVYGHSMRLFLFVDLSHLYLINTEIVDFIMKNPENETSHQRSLQVEGLSVLKKQHDVSFQVTQAAVTMAADPLLQQQQQP